MFGYIANIGPASLVLILVIALVIFGPGKLPGVGKALGESISGFKKGLNGDEGEKKEETKEVEWQMAAALYRGSSFFHIYL